MNLFARCIVLLMGAASVPTIELRRQMTYQTPDNPDSSPHSSPHDRLDQATAARLAKLRTMPVDTSRLEQFIRAEIPRPRTQERVMRIGWVRPLQAAAGFVLIVSAAVWLLTTSSRPVMASPAELAQFHEDLLAGRGVMQVDSVADANKSLLAQWAQSPQIPDVPSDHVMACCMKSIQNRKVACVLLKGEAEPVTMTIANASDMSMPDSPTVVRGGVSYNVNSSGNLNMVMTQRQGRWICLIGRLSVDRLMTLAGGIQF
jgi:hypothetical protein